MSKETEATLKELIKKNDFSKCSSLDEMNTLLGKAIEQYNSNLPTRRGSPDEYDCLELAQNATTKEEAIKYAKKALALNPQNIDAQSLIAEIKFSGTEKLIEEYEKLLKIEEKRLTEQENIDFERDKGYFYGLLETRPYMRLYLQYVQTLIQYGCYSLSEKVCLRMLELCSNDNLGIRYILAALYAYFEKKDELLSLVSKFNEESIQFLMPLAIVNYKTRNMVEAKKVALKSNSLNKNLCKVANKIATGDLQWVQDIAQADSYCEGSVEEAVCTIYDSLFLYISSSRFLSWYCTVTSPKK